VSAVPKKTSREEPVLEIQVHPSEIRWGVRYFFFSRRALFATVASIVVLVAFVVTNLFIAPKVFRYVANRREYLALVGERVRQGERLHSLTEQLKTIEARTEELHLIMSRVFLTYGLESDQSIGQGGYPFAAQEGSDSIYSAAIQQARTVEAGIDEQLAVLGTFIGEIQSFEEAHSDQVTTTPSLCPLKSGDFVLTSPFGTRRSPFTKNLDEHPGIDLAATTGTPIRAPADGVVVFAGRYPIKQSVSWWRYGNLVALRNGDRFITLYGHCSEIQVRTGQKVKQGDVMATVGNSGWSTNPHLHYEVRRKNEEGRFVPVDPRVYILDHRWRDEEQLLVRGRRAPDLKDFEPLPRLIGR
jgi:murein DD-endopeptidase MepM/ murein hydrolase activator NlpD